MDQDHSDNSYSMDTSARGLLGSDSHRYRLNRRNEYQNPSYHGALGGLTKKESIVNPSGNHATPRFKINQSMTSSLSNGEVFSFGALGGAGMIVTKMEDKKIIETRAQQNWRKLRTLVKTSIVQQRLNVVMVEKDKRIQQGEKIEHTIVNKTFGEMLRTAYIHPQGKFLKFWKAFLQFSLVYYTLTYSYRLSFDESLESLYNPNPINIVNFCVDGFCAVNILLKFFTGIKLPNNTVLWNKKTIAKNYLYYGTLIIDVISLIPFEFYNRNFAIIKLLRIIHLRGLSKSLLKISDFVVPIFIRGLKSIVIGKFIAHLTAIVFSLVILFHLLSCAWVLLGYADNSDEKTWLGQIISFDDYYSMNKFNTLIMTTYVTSLFHVVQTVTTIGYGNSTGYSLREHVYSMALLFFGLLLFTMVFEKIKEIVKSLNEAEDLENQQVEELDAWLNMVDRNIIESIDVYDTELTDAYKRTLRHKVDQDWQDLFVNNEQFRHLSHKMKQEVLTISFLPYERRFSFLFRFLTKSFLHEIFILSESRLYLSRELIIDKGTFSRGLFLILEGSVFVAGASPDHILAKLPVYSYFGEFFILTNKHSKFYVIAKEDVSCLFIPEDVFKEMESKYSDDIKRLRALAYQREAYFTNMETENFMLKHRARKSPRKESRRSSGNKTSARSSVHNSQINLLQTEATVERKSREFPRSDSFTLTEPSNQKKVRRTQVTPLFKKVPTTIESGSPAKVKSSVSIAEDISPSRTPIQAFDWESALELESNPYINESPLMPHAPKFNQLNGEIEFGSEYQIENDIGNKRSEKLDKEDESTADDKYSESDELNRSDIYPLESAIPDFDDLAQIPKIRSYLKERIVYIRNKISQMKERLDVDAQYLSQKAKVLNKKMAE